MVSKKLIKEINVDGKYYDISDTTVDTLVGEHEVAPLSDAAWKNVDTEVTEDSDNLITSGAVEDYVSSNCATEQDLEGKVSKNGDTVNGNLTIANKLTMNWVNNNSGIVFKGYAGGPDAEFKASGWTASTTGNIPMLGFNSGSGRNVIVRGIALDTAGGEQSNSSVVPKSYVDNNISKTFRFKGIIDTYDELDDITDAKQGDVWYVSESSKEYYWIDYPDAAPDAEERGWWQVFGYNQDLSSITLGKGTEDEVTLTAYDLKRLLAMLV